MGLASILILLNFVVPRFAAIFEGTHMKIPVPTQIMLEASDIRAGLLVDRRWRRWWRSRSCWRVYTGTAAGRLWWDGARLKIPLLGDALLKAETARFARAMATLVANTVPLVQSIGIAAATLNNGRSPDALEAWRRASSAAKASPRRCARPACSRRWPRIC